MKIAIYSDNFYPELSGIADSLHLLGTTLAERGHSIMFVTHHYSASDHQEVNVPNKERDYGPFEKTAEGIRGSIRTKRLFSISWLGSPTGQGRIAIPFAQTVHAIHEFQPDIIHTNTPFGVGLEALLDAKLNTIPIIGTNHTPVTEFIPRPFKTYWIANIALGYFSWYYNRCAFITAPCRSLLDEMHRHGFHKPSQALANPLDLKEFTPPRDAAEKEQLKKQFGFTNNTVLYTGRLAEEKQVEVIMRAIAKIVQENKEIPDICFALTGVGAYEKKLRSLGDQLGIMENVRFLGFVDSAVFPLLYKAADVFCIMSVAESQSLSLMQAMASGLPVIGANARALPEYITKENGLIVEVGDSSALAKAILQILSSPSMKEALGQGGIRSAALCDRTVITKKWEKIYEEYARQYTSK